MSIEEHRIRRSRELASKTEEELLSSIHSIQQAIDRSPDSENGCNYDVACLFNNRGEELDELGRRKSISRHEAYVYYTAW